MSHARPIAALAPAALLLGLLASCGSQEARQDLPAAPAATGQAQVAVQLQVVGGPSSRWADFAGLTLAGARGDVALGLEAERIELGSAARLLATGEVPAGEYRGLRVVLEQVYASDPAEEGVGMLLRNASTLLPLPMNLGDGDTVNLVLRLDLGRSLPDAVTFDPTWSLSIAGSLLSFEMVLAADGRAGGVAVVDRKRMRMHRSLLPGHGVSGLVLGQASSELFAIDASTDEVVVFDLAQGSERDRRRLPSGGRPSWATHLPDGAGLAVSLGGRRELEFLELPSMLATDRVATGRAPGRLLTSSEQRRIYALLPESHELVVFSTDTREVIADRVLEAGPADLALNREQDLLAVVCSRAGRLMLIDAASLETRASWFVGNGLRAVLFDSQENRAFVATASPPRLFAVDLATGQTGPPAVLPSAAADLEMDPEGRLIWAACPGAGRIVAVDRFHLRIRAEIPVPGAPDRLLLPGLRRP